MPTIDAWIGKARGCLRFTLVLLLASCGGGDGGGMQFASGLRLQQVASGFNTPLFAVAPPGDTSRLFVVEKGGVIRIVDLATGQVRPIPFLTVTVNTAGERGLLGLAFHPNYSGNGFFYVNLINTAGDTEIRRYTVLNADPNVADASSEFPIMKITQPPGLSNHKAGWLGFGPVDGFLYAALGDGGGGGDPGENGQNVLSLLGKILRIDVNPGADDFPGDANRNYAIPPGNPFVGATGADEIWAFGLRNPFRNSFDRGTGDFYIADVGQDRREEVNVVAFASALGINFGWNDMEASLCFQPTANCNPSLSLTLPLLEYAHDNNACSGSITGGYVYRGTAIAGLGGTYFYADFCQGFVRSFRLVNGTASEQTDWVSLRPPGGSITSFGEDAAGELYIVTAGGGLFRIVQ